MIYKGKWKVSGNEIAACDYGFILKKVDERIKTEKKLLVSPVVSYNIVLALINKDLQNSFSKSDYLFPDSQWVRWSLRLLYGIKLKDRVYGPELMLRICGLSEKRGYKVFIYGARKKVLKKLEKILLQKFPRIKIVGMEPADYRISCASEKEKLTSLLKRSGASVLFVGLGSPRQDIFSNELLYKKPYFAEPLVVVPVGAAFDFISGAKPQAPLWMQRAGLEWLFRLIQEPRRLWKRYLFYGFAFFFLILIQKLSLLFNLSGGDRERAKL